MKLSAAYPYVLGLATTEVVEPLIDAPFLTIADGLRRFDGWSPERRSAWQAERLRRVLDHAASSVPFYRSLLRGAGPDARLSDLPVVDKAALREEIGRFRSAGWEHMSFVNKATAGTTGDSWRYELDRRAWAHIRGAQIRLWEHAGYRYGERIVILGTPPSLAPGGPSMVSRLRSLAERRIYSAAGVQIEPRQSTRRILDAVQANGVVWYGYASMIAAMAQAALDAGMRAPGPVAIITTSEPLQPAWREQIEAAFRAPVYDEYGCNDGGIIAMTCRAGRFHVAENVSIVEVLEGDRPCPPGVEGDVVVTNLHARVMPFIRYRVGDRGVLGSGTCECGRGGRTLERVTGRCGDSLDLPDGTELSYVTFGPIFWETPHIRRWQIVQERHDRVTVRLDAEPGFTEREAGVIRDGIRRRSRGLLGVDIRLREPIERTGAGKQRVVINRVRKNARR
jgi:phenylacetate-CoA ligase